MGALPRPSLVSLDAQRPLAPASGLVSAGLRTVRRLPEHAARLSLFGVQTALNVAASLRREYRTVREDGWAAALSRRPDGEEPLAFPGRRESRLGWPEEPGQRTPRSARVHEAPSAAAREFGAPGASSDIVERVEADLAEGPDAAGEADALPVPDFDHLTIGSLRARLRRLSTPELLALRDYEKEHANRLQVITMLDNRIAKLDAGEHAGTDDTAETPTD
ncbi:MAG TPA: hypothetical protein VKP64_02730 [Mycobacteriales bacterium]|nr:hypothetical protein [Mycobacteriales bacterium]